MQGIPKNLDKVTLVDERDEVVGQADKIKAHIAPGQLHRACSVFLFDENGRLLIQKRSTHKIVAAQQWGNTVCGNVRPTESYKECALRRLEEELGITKIDLKTIGKFKYQVDFEDSFTEKEIDTVFAQRVKSSLQLELNPLEVSAVDWIKLQHIHQKERDFAPWVAKILSQKKINQNLKEYGA